MMFNAMLNYISVEGDCPDEWTSIAGGCYKFLPEKYNWEDAKEACHMLHGWLVEIESEEQNDAIHDAAKEITHLILISDLRMLCPIWRIFYQLGESHLNVFWHHILENLLSVDIFYQIGIMFYQMFTITEGSIFFC